MKRSLIVLSVASLLFAGVASAEVKKGDVMLDVLAGWSQQNLNIAGAGDVTVWFAALRPGIALTDNIRVAGVGAVIHTTFTGGHATAWAVGASGEYVFMPTNILNPFVGGQIAYAAANISGVTGTQDGWFWGPRAGALYTLNRTNNLFGEFNWMIYQGKIRNALDQGFMVLFGIEHKFKTGQ